MKKELDLIIPGDVLSEEFMKPLNISQNRLARDLDLAQSHINGIVHGKKSISADVALRLGEYFGCSAQMWMNLQSHYDLEKAERDIWPDVQPRIRKMPYENEDRV